MGMSTRYFVDRAGNYLGGFDGAEPPSGAVEVPVPPDHASHKWVNGAWSPAAEPVPKAVPLFKARAVMRVTPHPVHGTLLAAVKAAITTMADPVMRAVAEEGLERASVLSRYGAIVTTLAATLGLDDAKLDELFKQADAISA